MPYPERLTRVRGDTGSFWPRLERVGERERERERGLLMLDNEVRVEGKDSE